MKKNNFGGFKEILEIKPSLKELRTGKRLRHKNDAKQEIANAMKKQCRHITHLMGALREEIES